MRKVHIIILLGLCAVLWSVCMVRVIFFPKTLSVEETYVRTAVSYRSTYRSPSAIRMLSPIRHSEGLRNVTVRVPQVSMHSTSRGVNSSPMKIHMTSSHSVQVVGSGSGAGTIATTSSGRSGSRGIVYSQASAIPQMQGLLTSASMVGGGVTAAETYSRMVRTAPYHAGSPAKSPTLPDGSCEHCDWVYEGGQWICSQCGANVLDGCDCGGYCGCPIDLNWGVMLFLMLLAVGYGAKKSRGISREI